MTVGLVAAERPGENLRWMLVLDRIPPTDLRNMPEWWNWYTRLSQKQVPERD